MAFDTLAYAQRLKAAGVAAAQAEAHAQALRDTVTETTASKADLESGFARLDGRMDLLETRMDLLETRMDERIRASEARLDERIQASEARLDERIQASETRMDERIRASETRQEAANARRDARMMVFIVAVAALAVAAAELIP